MCQQSVSLLNIVKRPTKKLHLESKISFLQRKNWCEQHQQLVWFTKKHELNKCDAQHELYDMSARININNDFGMVPEHNFKAWVNESHANIIRYVDSSSYIIKFVWCITPRLVRAILGTSMLFAPIFPFTKDFSNCSEF